MSDCRKAIKQLAQIGVDCHLIPSEGKNKKKDLQLLLPFTAGATVVRLNQYYGDIGLRHLDRRIFSLEYDTVQYKEDTNKYKRLRKIIRGRLLKHVDSTNLQACENVSLVMDLCQNNLEFFEEDSVSDIHTVQDVQEQFTTESTKKFHVSSAQLQCITNEFQLLRVLNGCNAVVKTFNTLESVIKVSGDYPQTLKKDGKAYRVFTLFEVNWADFTLKSWHPVFYSSTATHLIHSRTSGSELVSDISFSTQSDHCVLMHGSDNELLKEEGQKILDLFNLDGWISSLGNNQLQYSSDPGFNNIMLCTERRSYDLHISGTYFTLLVENRKHFRLNKETGIFDLLSEGSAIPQIIFPLSSSGSVIDRSQIIVYASLLAGKLIKATAKGYLSLQSLKYQYRLSASSTVSCTDIQALLRIVYGRDLYEMLGIPFTASSSAVSQRVVELKFLISSIGCALEKKNPNLVPTYLLNRLESALSTIDY